MHQKAVSNMDLVPDRELVLLGEKYQDYLNFFQDYINWKFGISSVTGLLRKLWIFQKNWT